jgi:serine O-acetyltransferase
MPDSTTPGFDGAHLGFDRLAQSVDRLVDSIRGEPRLRHVGGIPLPHRHEVVEALERVIWLVYPGFVGPRDLDEARLRPHVDAVVRDLAARLASQVCAALRYSSHGERNDDAVFDQRCRERAAGIVHDFLAQLPALRSALSLDVQAAVDGDPAAHHADEIIFCYPGLRALSIHRIAHMLHRIGVPMVPRIMAEHAHSVTGIDIHPAATIGRSFFIDHGTGVVIGATAVIGDHCRLYQGVTLGAKSFPKDREGRYRREVKRHPTLEDHVVVYAGSTILGGDTVIGAGSVINGGVFLTQSVPPGTVVRAPKVDVRTRANPEMPPENYVI